MTTNELEPGRRKSISNKLKKLSDQRIKKEYKNDVRAISRLAKEFDVSIQSLYLRLEKLGIKRRSNSDAHKGIPAWNKGNGYIDSNGYRVLSHNGRQVREHRLVAESVLGRKLKTGEVVHHKNGNRSDNRQENLEIYPNHSAHMKEHMTSEKAREIGAIGLPKILKNRKIKAALKAVKGK